MDDTKQGAYGGRYTVTRNIDPNGKHRSCRYYVLDLVHDKFSGPALLAYADACEAEFPLLAKDLRSMVANISIPVQLELPLWDPDTDPEVGN